MPAVPGKLIAPFCPGVVIETVADEPDAVGAAPLALASGGMFQIVIVALPVEPVVSRTVYVSSDGSVVASMKLLP